VVLALVSPEWLASGWCKSEIDAARMMGKKVIVALVGIDKTQVPVDLIDEQFVDLSADPQAYRRLKEGLKRAGLDPTSFPFVAGRRPYPGLAYLEEQDAAVFFGRDAQIVRGLDEIRRLVRTGLTRMLVILGASGRGIVRFHQSLGRRQPGANCRVQAGRYGSSQRAPFQRGRKAHRHCQQQRRRHVLAS
jgi:hypothetical protein